MDSAGILRDLGVRGIGFAAAAAALCASLAISATVDSPETWSGGDTAGWDCRDQVSGAPLGAALNTVDASLRWEFGDQYFKFPPEDWLVKADAGSSGGTLVGDYVAAGVKAIAFRLRCDLAVKVWVSFHNENTGRTWRYRVPGIVADRWQTVIAPTDLDFLKEMDGVSDPDAFAADLANVTWVGVEVVRNGSLDAQEVRLDDFELLTVGKEYKEWIEQFEESDWASRRPSDDLDGDGSDNYGEWVAGTSAGNAAEQFNVVVEQEESASGGIRLRWASEEGRKYRVWRSTDLRNGFEPISSLIDADIPENIFEDTGAAGEGPYFYKVEVVQE